MKVYSRRQESLLMPSGGLKTAPESKGPVSQEKSGDDIFNEFRRILQGVNQDMNSRFDEIKQEINETKQ